MVMEMETEINTEETATETETETETSLRPTKMWGFTEMSLHFYGKSVREGERWRWRWKQR